MFKKVQSSYESFMKRNINKAIKNCNAAYAVNKWVGFNTDHIKLTLDVNFSYFNDETYSSHSDLFNIPITYTPKYSEFVYTGENITLANNNFNKLLLDVIDYKTSMMSGDDLNNVKETVEQLRSEIIEYDGKN